MLIQTISQLIQVQIVLSIIIISKVYKIFQNTRQLEKMLSDSPWLS